MMQVSDQEAWDSWVEANTDPYGKCCVDYARAWAELMEERMAEGAELEDIAKNTSYEVNQRPEFGITGFMYGAAVSMLSQAWVHGERLRKWHNLDTQIGTENGSTSKATSHATWRRLIDMDETEKEDKPHWDKYVESLEKRLKKLEDRLANEGGLTEFFKLQEQVKQLRQDIKTIDEGRMKLEERVAELEQRVEYGVGAVVLNLQERVAGIESKTWGITASVSDIQERVARLERIAHDHSEFDSTKEPMPWGEQQ